MTPEELKAHLMAQAEAMIDKMLAHKPKVEDITLSDIEQLAIGSGRDFRESVLGSLVEESSQSQTREAMRCPACGGQMHYKGQRGRDVVTEAGEVHVERDYYYCPACRHGVFPPGSTLEAD
jgi:DNA-directed RNA polymerase subunit RPC12/RpoP